MKVFLAGGTGALGHYLLPALIRSGYSVTVVARSQEKANWIKESGATPIKVDLFSESAVKEAVKGHDIVINMTTNVPPLSKSWSQKAWEPHNNIRRIVSKNLAQAALQAKSSKFIQESVVFFYADNGNQWIDEDSPLKANGWEQPALTAEKNALSLQGTGVKPVVLRFGNFYAPNSEHTISTIKAARYWISTILGMKHHYYPMIHIYDAAEAVVAAIKAEEGIYNVVDDEPLTKGQLDEALAQALGKGGLFRVPMFPIPKSSVAADFLFRSLRVSNKKFKEATGWNPKYKTASEALKLVVNELNQKPKTSL